MSDAEMLQEARRYWDQEAATFDDEPDHGLHDPVTLGAWTHFLKAVLPPATATILDIGCGTGSLSVVLAGLGYQVTGIDLSPAMISLAYSKAAAMNLKIEFQVMDAAFPQLPKGQFGAIVCRHLLWALPKPEEVLQNWVDLLEPNGRLILIEGYWEARGGLHSTEIVEILPAPFTNISIRDLSKNHDFWGKNVNDERYAIIADRKS